MLFPRSTCNFDSDRDPRAILDDISRYCKERKTYRCRIASDSGGEAPLRFSLINLMVMTNVRTYVDGIISVNNGRCAVSVTVRASVFALVVLYMIFCVMTAGSGVYTSRCIFVR